MDLKGLFSLKGKSGKKKRVGRGYGSGKGGHTTGKGSKGQKSRAGKNIPFGFEGGQVPLYKRLPQIGGFRNPTKKDVTAVQLGRLNSFKDGEEITVQRLFEAGIISRMPRHGVKVLRGGEFSKKLVLKGIDASKGAQEDLEKAGATLVDESK